MPNAETERRDIRQESEADHKARADRLHALSLAAAAGSLFYLIGLEELLPPEVSQCPWAIRTAWYMAYLSVTFGSIHLWLEMFLPIHAANLATEAAKAVHNMGKEAVLARAKQKISRHLLWGIPVYVHVACLFFVFFFSAIYRFSN
jgi:hypothetical protein